MISCFKGGNTSTVENGINNTHAAVYTSISDFDQERVPKISKIIESLRQYDVFKYSAYRTAFKLRTIQKASKLHLVDLSVMTNILKEYECENNSIDETISFAKAENLISTLYTEAGKKIGIPDEPNVMALLFLAFLQNTFVENDKPLLFIHVKLALTLFSSAKLTEKYKHFFHYCSNGSSTISRQNVLLLLNCLAKIAEIVGEQVTFGTHLVPAALKNLMKFSKGKVTAKLFQKWLLMEPQTLVWISTLHRIAVSETTQHYVSCDYCRVNPLVGLRYRCLQCINYNLCQNCFLSGHINKRHKDKHPVQEFCHPASTWQETKATINAMKNKLPFARCSVKPYLSFDDETFCESVRDINKNSSRNSLMYHTLKKTTTAYIVKELSSIINKLEDEKRQISSVVEDCNKENESDNQQHKNESNSIHKSGKSLQSFNSSLELQLRRLKELLQSLKSPEALQNETSNNVSPVPHVAPFSKSDHYFESTPLNSGIIPIESEQKRIPFSDSNHHSNDATEKQRYLSASLDFSNLLSSVQSEALTDSRSLGSTYNISGPSENHFDSASLGLSKYMNESSPLKISAAVGKFNDSKLSPIYLYSSDEFEDSLNVRAAAACKIPVTPMKSSVSYPSLKINNSSMCALNKDKSLEAMELELQAMLKQIEQLLPQMSSLSNDSLSEKEKVYHALSDVEDAVKKLSHISLALSTGSTDL